MKVLVCGGRAYGEMPKGIPRGTQRWVDAMQRANAQKDHLRATLSALPTMPTLIIHGDAHGADRLADMWARDAEIARRAFPANWWPNGRAGGLDRGAGHKRNHKMLVEGKPDLVVAFAGGAGTANMVDRAKKAGVPVMEFPDPTAAANRGVEERILE